MGTQLFALHFLTPVSSNCTIDRWMHLRNVAVGDENASEKIDSMFRVTFAEDKKILEAIQEQTDHQQNQNPVHIAIDKGSIAYRRRIEELIKSETSFKASA